MTIHQKIPPNTCAIQSTLPPAASTAARAPLLIRNPFICTAFSIFPVWKILTDLIPAVIKLASLKPLNR